LIRPHLAALPDSRPVAELEYDTSAAKRRDGTADGPAECHEQRVVTDPVFPGKFLSQGKFRFIGRPGRNIPQPVRNPVHMGIDANSLFAVTQSDNEVRRFPAHPFQRQQFIDRIGNPGMETLDQVPADLDDRPGLVPVETDRVNGPRYRLLGKHHHRLRTIRQGKQPIRRALGHLILGPQAENRRNQDGKGTFPVIGVLRDDRHIPCPGRFLQKGDDPFYFVVVHGIYGPGTGQQPPNCTPPRKPAYRGAGSQYPRHPDLLPASFPGSR